MVMGVTWLWSSKDTIQVQTAEVYIYRVLEREVDGRGE